MVDILNRYPMSRLLLCYAAGIVAAHVLYPHASWLFTCGVVCCVVSLVAAFATFALRRRLKRWHVALAPMLLFVSLGITQYTASCRNLHCEWSPQKQLYQVRLASAPIQRSNTFQCALEVDCYLSDDLTLVPVNRRIMGYFASDSLALHPGDLLYIHARVQAPRDFNPDDRFNYAQYLLQQGVSGTAYIPAGQWSPLDCNTNLSLRESMSRLRQRLYAHLQPIFQGDELGVLAALTLGDKQGLTPEARAIYSHAGASHALALSGLHVGIIYGLLAFALRAFRRRRMLRQVADFATILLLWLFALLVGMSPSVVRAVLMCTLYIVARCISRDSSALHVLSLAALAMLLVRPLYLFDVGFQLSYMAMAAILTVGPHVEQLLTRRHLPWVISYPLSIIGLSLVAQLGTFPLVLHHFGTFPLYFLVTNLLLIPVLTLLLPLMMGWWTLILLRVPLAVPFGAFLQESTRLLNSSLAHIGSWPHAVLHVSSFTLPAVLCTYLLILFLALTFIKRWSRGLVWSLLALLGLVLCV